MAHEGHDHDEPHHHQQPHHAHEVQTETSVSCFVVTVSDTRTEKEDLSGRCIVDALRAAGHGIAGTQVVRDDRAEIVKAVEHGLSHGARVLVFTGGTGISRRDVTLEALEPLFEKHLSGFGELFRSLSFAEVGPRAMLSRAAAGTYQGALIFALPGSPKAVKLAMEKLVATELGHFVRMVST
jgi:molybdopterin adenylyltransferase